jgi:hypothetical protein
VACSVTRYVCEKIVQNVAQHIVCQTKYTTFTVETVWAIFVFFQKLPNEKKSPNLVTLVA